MAAAACKIIINHTFFAVTEGLTEILSDPELYGDKLDPEKAAFLLGSLATSEAGAYDGGGSTMTVQGVVAELVTAGVLDGTVWRILASPS